MKIKFELYIDFDKEYNDHIFENSKFRLCPLFKDLDFYHEESIKEQLVSKFNDIDPKEYNKYKNNLFFILELTEEQLFYLSLKYDNFLKFAKEYKIDES